MLLQHSVFLAVGYSSAAEAIRSAMPSRLRDHFEKIDCGTEITCPNSTRYFCICGNEISDFTLSEAEAHHTFSAHSVGQLNINFFN